MTGRARGGMQKARGRLPRFARNDWPVELQGVGKLVAEHFNDMLC